MKLDQETVVKHQFWFLLGGYFLLWLIAVLWMKFTYPSAIDDLKKAYDGAANGVKQEQTSGPINTTAFVPPWEKETKEFSDHKGVIWGEAWKFQEGMYDWPEEWRKKYDMTSPQAPISSDDRTEYKDKLYPKQIKEVANYAPKWLNPVELKDGFDNIFQPRKSWEEIPTREEIWLLQEDYWVKRELLIVVYEAMAQQALMDPIPIDEKKEPMPKGVEARYRFQNTNWEITLNIRKNDKGFIIGGDSTIKNVHPSRHPQPLTSAKGGGVWFNVAQDNVRTTFEVRGEPVGWNETKKFSAEDYAQPLFGIKWDKETLKQHPIYVSQGFDQTNCPIRRINAIELPKQDCRTFIWPLQPNHMLAQLDASADEQDPTKKAGAAPAAPAGPGGGAGGAGGAGAPSGSSAMMMGGLNRPGGPGGGGTTPSGNLTPNNHLDRDRYLQPANLDKKLNPPSRHLPLAIQLIVEQTHMHDLMLALANSRLRFQITQVEFNHVKDFTPQSAGDGKAKKDGSDAEGPQVFTGDMGGMRGGSMQMQMRMQMQSQMRGMQGPAGGGDPMQRSRGGPPSGPMMRGPMGGSGGPPMGGGAGGQMRGGPMGGPGGPMMMRAPGGPGMGGAQMQSKSIYAPGGNRGVGVAGPGGVNQAQAEAEQHDDNLVELTIYGIATLYRAPDAPPSAPQAAQPGATAQTGQQPATTPGGASTPAAAPQAGASGTTPQAGAAAQPPAATPPQGGATQPQATPAQPSGGGAPQQTPPKQSSDGKAPASKQSDKSVDQQKAPPPPPPPAGTKR